MMTSEEKRRLWLDEFTREFAFQRANDTLGNHGDDDYARFAAAHATEVLAHASRLMPDFAEPEREFDREAAAARLLYKIHEYGTVANIVAAIIDGKIPGVKYTPPTTTNPG